MAAVVAFTTWDPDLGLDHEPQGWTRHIRTMRRRTHGDPNRETSEG